MDTTPAPLSTAPASGPPAGLAASLAVAAPGPSEPPEPSIWRRSVESTDIDEFAGAQADWTLHYEQLSPGRFEGRLQHVQLPGLRMVHERNSCATRQRGRMGTGHIGFAMPLEVSGHASFNGQPLVEGSVMIGRSEELDLCLPAGTGLIAIMVDAGLLASLWQHMYGKGLSSWIEQQFVIQARSSVVDDLRRLHLEAMDQAARTPELLADQQAARQLRDALLVEWIEALPPRVATDEVASAEARKRVVDRACELVLSRPEEPMSVLEVCDRIGASPRKLEYCFRHVLGISPARYFRAVRLNGVRRELRRSSGSTVQDLAARWGFWHMGEFGAAYRAQFGEKPSQTPRAT